MNTLVKMRLLVHFEQQARFRKCLSQMFLRAGNVNDIDRF